MSEAARYRVVSCHFHILAPSGTGSGCVPGAPAHPGASGFKHFSPLFTSAPPRVEQVRVKNRSAHHNTAQ